MADTRDILIQQGKTFSLCLRWEGESIVYRPITGMANSAPVRITCPSHGVPDGWRVAVTNAKGMTELNAEANAVKDKDYHPATVIDADTLELNDVNAAGFKPYQSGGYLQYNTPIDLAGYEARMSIKDKAGGVEKLSLTTTNGRVVIDPVRHTIALSISATDTAALEWKKGVYDLELISSTGVVTALMSGGVVVAAEITA